MPEVLYEDIVEVEERVVLCQDNCQLNLYDDNVQGITGEQVHSMMYSAFMTFLFDIVYVYDFHML